MSKKNKNRQIVQQIEEIENNITETEADQTVDQSELDVETTPVEEVQESIEEVVDTIREQIGEKEPESVEEVPKQESEEVKEEVPVIEEKKEIKPIPTKGVLIVEKKSVATEGAAAPVPASVKKFNELAEKYIGFMKNETITEDDRRRAVYILTSICQYVLSSSDKRVFDACYQFFLKNRAIMLVVDRVTDGLYKFADKEKVTKIVQWYVTFQSLVESKLLKSRFSLNVTTIRRVFNNDELTNWLILKKK